MTALTDKECQELGVIPPTRSQQLDNRDLILRFVQTALNTKLPYSPRLHTRMGRIFGGRGWHIGWWDGGAGSREIKPEDCKVPVYISRDFKLTSPGFRPPHITQVVRVCEAIGQSFRDADRPVPTWARS